MSSTADRLEPLGQPFRFGPAATAADQTGTSFSFKLLLLFLLVLYSNLAKLYPPVEVLRPAFVVALGAILVMFVEIAGARQHFRLSRIQGYLLIAFLGAAGVSTFYAIYARLAFETTIELTKVILIYVLLENTVTSESRIRAVMWTILVGGLFPAIGTIVHYHRGILVEGDRGAWIGTFANPNEAAYALVILIPVAVVLAGTSRWSLRLALWGIVAAYLVAIYLTFSRGGLLGLFAVVGIFGWKQKSALLKIGMVAALVAGMLLIGLFWARDNGFANLSSDTTVNQRIATFKAGMAMFYDNPLFGVGPGCSIVAYPLYVPKEAHCGCQEQLMIHNAFIQVLSEIGLAGFLPFMGFLGFTMFQLWNVQRKADARGDSGSVIRYAAGLELALWGFVVCGMSGGFSYTWFPYILIGLAVATTRIAGLSRPDTTCRV